jgi:hypothetical protein
MLSKMPAQPTLRQTTPLQTKPLSFGGHYLLSGTNEALSDHMNLLLAKDIDMECASLKDSKEGETQTCLFITGEEDIQRFRSVAPPQTVRPNPHQVNAQFTERIQTALKTLAIEDFLSIIDDIKKEFCQAMQVQTNPQWPEFIQRITQPHLTNTMDAATVNAQLKQEQFNPLNQTTGLDSESLQQ